MPTPEAAAFNKEQFAALLKKAQGTRSQNFYQYDARVSSTYIGKLLKCQTDVAPSPEVIRKLASAAQNDVTYEDLMEAAGHIQRMNICSASDDSSHWGAIKTGVTDYLLENKSSLIDAISKSNNISKEISERIVHDFLSGFGDLSKEKQIELISTIVSNVKIVKESDNP